jgi:transposase
MTGRPRVSDRQVINGMVHKIRAGIARRDIDWLVQIDSTIVRAPPAPRHRPKRGSDDGTNRTIPGAD